MAGSCAVVLAVVSLAMDFGWLATSLSSIVGGATGYWAARTYLNGRYSTPSPQEAGAIKSYLRDGGASYRRGSAENASVISLVLGPILSLPTPKRWASLFFWHRQPPAP
jgi:hypothetical protein